MKLTEDQRQEIADVLKDYAESFMIYVQRQERGNESTFGLTSLDDAVVRIERVLE